MITPLHKKPFPYSLVQSLVEAAGTQKELGGRR